jgi:hypothetical protein
VGGPAEAAQEEVPLAAAARMAAARVVAQVAVARAAVALVVRAPTPARAELRKTVDPFAAPSGAIATPSTSATAARTTATSSGTRTTKRCATRS